jgi:hypothetical protein
MKNTTNNLLIKWMEKSLRIDDNVCCDNFVESILEVCSTIWPKDKRNDSNNCEEIDESPMRNWVGVINNGLFLGLKIYLFSKLTLVLKQI